MKSLVTIGTFDGVHRGHQKLIRWVLRRAGRLNLKTTVVVLDRPPRFFFHPDKALPLLTTPEERRELILRMGVDSVRILPFNRNMARVPHTRFFEDYLLRRCRAGGLFVGPDFAFGRARKGDIPWMRRACDVLGMHFGILPLVRVGEHKIGSSHIRQLILEGRLPEANRLLGRPHFLLAAVIKGQGLGRKIGFPTLNLDVPESKLLPSGVFRVRVSGPGILRRVGVCNVGVRPTVSSEGRRHVEVHLPGFKGSLYGRTLKVEFLNRIRPEKKFASLNDLREQIARDVASLR